MADTGKSDSSKMSGGLMGLVGKILGTLAVISAALMLAAVYDIGQFGLREMIYPIAWLPLALYLAGAIAPLFLTGGKAAGGASAGGDEVTAKLSEFQSKVNSRFAAMQNSLDALMGQDYESIVAENKELKEQLDAIHQAERDKVDAEMDGLRQRNEELEAQIKQWAMQTVSDAVGQRAA